ncbi:MAG: class B sortase [Christensenella sp.]|nr:class B sortase [Christensenella sp.]
MKKKKCFRVNKQVLIKRVIWLSFFLLSAVLLFSIYKFVRILRSYRESENNYRQINEIALSTASPVPNVPASAAKIVMPSEVPIEVDWDSLERINRDIVAWLYCEGTPINYPIVQAKDNEYYLTRDFNRRKSESGALFLDCRNNIVANDENHIIYGHRMKDDSMFGSVPQYAEQSYCDEHPTMYLLTPEQNYRVEIFACRTVHSEDKYFETCFESKNAFQRYLNKAVEQSYWQSDTTVNTDNPSLALVTCSTYTNADNPRLLVHGCLIPIS